MSRSESDTRSFRSASVGARLSAAAAGIRNSGNNRNGPKRSAHRPKSKLLGQAVSRFMGAPGPSPSDVSMSKVDILRNTKARAQLLKKNVGKHFNLDLSGARGLPIREALQGMYRIKRDATIMDCTRFLCHFALMVLIVASISDVHEAFTTNDGVLDLFLDEPFEGVNYKKNFYEIMTQGEFWSWVNGPLSNGLYPTAWYNGDVFGDADRGYVLHNLRLVGGVRFRQLRMPHDSCLERRFVDECVERSWNVTTDGQCLNGYNAAQSTCCVGRFDTKDGSCYTSFDKDKQDTSPFGPVGNESRYTWSDGQGELVGLFGFGEDYGTGGFSVELPAENHEGQASAILARMEADRWTDEQTYAVAVYFNMYSTFTKLMTTVRVLFEFFPTGHVIKSSKIITVRLVLYQAKMDKVRMILEIVYLCGFAYFVGREVHRFWRSSPKGAYFRKLRNLYELMLLSMEGMMMAQWLLYVWSPIRENFDVNAEQFTDMYHTTESAQLAFSWAGAVGLASCVKLFQYMSLSKKLNTLWLTLERAASDLVAFFIGFLVVVCGFAFAAEHIFGFVLADYHNFTSSFSTLLRFVLGIFDYRALAEARPALAPWFFALHVFVMMMVVVNTFIAVISKYFDEVHTEAKNADKWQRTAKSFEGDIATQLTLRWLRLRSLCKRSSSQISFWETHLQSIRAEQAFVKQLRLCASQAKILHQLDLYDFFYKMFQQSQSDGIFIGEHELCGMFNKVVCPIGKHNSKNRVCHAHDLLVAYNEWKVVIMTGDVSAHKLVSSDVTTRGVAMYTVTKVNMGGLEQLRRVCLDDQRLALLNFDTKMRLKKILPIANIVQLEQSNTDVCAVQILFVDQSQAHETRTLSESGEAVHNKPETLYTLRFMSTFHKDEFLKTLFALHTKALKNHDHVDPAAGQTHDPAREARETRQKTAALLAGLQRQVEDVVGQIDSLRRQ